MEYNEYATLAESLRAELSKLKTIVQEQTECIAEMEDKLTAKEREVRQAEGLISNLRAKVRQEQSYHSITKKALGASPAYCAALQGLLSNPACVRDTSLSKSDVRELKELATVLAMPIENKPELPPAFIVTTGEDGTHKIREAQPNESAETINAPTNPFLEKYPVVNYECRGCGISGQMHKAKDGDHPLCPICDSERITIQEPKEDGASTIQADRDRLNAMTIDEIKDGIADMVENDVQEVRDFLSRNGPSRRKEIKALGVQITDKTLMLGIERGLWAYNKLESAYYFTPTREELETQSAEAPTEASDTIRPENQRYETILDERLPFIEKLLSEGSKTRSEIRREYRKTFGTPNGINDHSYVYCFRVINEGVKRNLWHYSGAIDRFVLGSRQAEKSETISPEPEDEK